MKPKLWQSFCPIVFRYNIYRCHSEPVLTLAWESPGWEKHLGDRHVGLCIFIVIAYAIVDLDSLRYSSQ